MSRGNGQGGTTIFPARDTSPVGTPPMYEVPAQPAAPRPRHVQGTTAQAPRVSDGWRRGRPIEDPEKMKTWGFISAKPSEYLVHMRNGELLEKSSGQGATCFKRRRDSVAIVPTSLQRLSFEADQVTLEKVGIAVKGLAVFRISDPVLAFRVLNFSYPERAQEKLKQTLTEMFVGATRRLVANLSVDECLQKRKQALGDELLREVAPVVGGQGRYDDETDAGWGVVIDTIEIQEVRVLSSKLFHDMQAPYRTQLERKADIARAAFEKETRLRTAHDQEEIDAAELLRERNTARTRAEVETEKGERAKALALLKLQNQAEVEQRQVAAKAELARRRNETERQAEKNKLEHQHLVQQRAVETETDLFEQRAAQTRRADLLRLEHDKQLAEGWLEQQELREQEQLAQQEHAQKKLEAELAQQVLRARAAHEQKLRDLEIAQQRAEIAAVEATTRAKLALTEKLPELASAVGQKFGEIKLTQIGGTEGLNFSPIVDAVGSVMKLAQGALGAIDAPPPSEAQPAPKDGPEE